MSREFRILERLKQLAIDIRRNSGGGDDVDWKLNQSVSRVLNSFIDNEERSSPTGLTEGTSNPSIHVAWWMMQHGYATGHGDTLDDLLSELAAQIVEKAKSPLFIYDQETGYFTLADDVPGTSQARKNSSEIGKEIPTAFNPLDAGFSLADDRRICRDDDVDCRYPLCDCATYVEKPSSPLSSKDSK